MPAFRIPCALLAAIGLGAGCAGRPGLEPVAVAVSPDGDGFEIPSIDAASSSAWLTRSNGARVTRVDLSDPSRLGLHGDISLEAYGRAVTSVAAHTGLIAVALLANSPSDPGTVVFLNTSGEVVRTVQVGHHPDMLVFTPAGDRVLVANEGEPAGGVDPPGSVSVIGLERSGDRLVGASVYHVRFTHAAVPDHDLTWLTPLSATPARMIEPEYIAVSPDGESAFVVCQENNGIAILDLRAKPPVFAALIDLGVVDHRDTGSGIDLIRDGTIRTVAANARSLRQPDGIAAVHTTAGVRFLTADEGDPRAAWGKDGIALANGAETAASSAGDPSPVLFGSRGVTLLDANGGILDTRTSLLERWMARGGPVPNGLDPMFVDRRAGKRGAEPEGIVAWRSGDRAFGAVTLERADAVALIEIVRDRLVVRDVLPLPRTGNQAEHGAPEGIALFSASGRTFLLVADERRGRLAVLRVTAVGTPITD